MRMLGFLRESVPIVLAGVLLVNMLHAIHVFDLIAGLTAPVITGLFGLPREAVTAIVIGLFRKDVAIGMLGTLGMTPAQLVVASTVLAMFFPCIATFAVMWKELGLRDTAKSVLAMIIASLIAGTVLNVML